MYILVLYKWCYVVDLLVLTFIHCILVCIKFKTLNI